MFRFLAAAALLVATLAPGLAHACASCGCGDPTLTVMGAEKPFEGRLRLAAELRDAHTSLGGELIDEQRWAAAAAFAPTDRVVLALELPLVARKFRAANLGSVQTFAPGDLELRAKVFVWQDRPAFARHLFALHGGLTLPTAPMQRSGGEPVDADAQAGAGAFAPQLGLSWAHFAGDLSFYVGGTARFPIGGWLDVEAGPAVLGSAMGQWQLLPWLAPRLGLESRHESGSRHGGDPIEGSRGHAVFASLGGVVSPLRDLLFSASLQLPLLVAFDGRREEGAGFTLGIVHDL